MKKILKTKSPGTWSFGSRREGAGIKAKDGCKKPTRHQVCLDADTVLILMAIGNGQLSLGVREAARRLAASGDASPFAAEAIK